MVTSSLVEDILKAFAFCKIHKLSVSQILKSIIIHKVHIPQMNVDQVVMSASSKSADKYWKFVLLRSAFT